jgi:hypothetical protein
MKMKTKIKKLQLNKNTTKHLTLQTGVKTGGPRTTGVSCEDCVPTTRCPSYSSPGATNVC